MLSVHPLKLASEALTAPGLLAIWCIKVFQEYFIFPCRDWVRPSLQGVLVTCRGRWYLEAEFWVLEMFMPLLLPGVSQRQPSQGTELGSVCACAHRCLCVYVCESTHT